MGLASDATAAMIWSYTLRCLNVPELRPLGVEMWVELKRGFPHVEEALEKGEAAQGMDLSGRAGFDRHRPWPANDTPPTWTTCSRRRGRFRIGRRQHGSRYPANR